MKCKDAQRSLSDFVDGALASQEAVTLERHLFGCSSCRAQRDQLLALKKLIAFKRHEKPDPLYLNGMLDEFHRRLVAQRSARRAVRWAGFNTDGIRHWFERAHRTFVRRPLVSLRYGLAVALTVFLAVNAAFLLRTRAPVSQAEQPAALSAETVSLQEPTYVLDQHPAEGSTDSVWF